MENILTHITQVENNELAQHHQLVKIFYISNLMKIDPIFDRVLRRLISISAKRVGEKLPRMTTIENMNKHEKADIFNPIEKTNTYGRKRTIKR